MKAIDAQGIYMVFGKRPEKAVERLQAGATREELRQEGTTAAVIDASFQVNEGEIFVVMGLSGSGKSTLIRTVNGLWKPTAGALELYGDDIAKMNPQQLRQARREKVSMVFQHFALFPHRTVGQNAAYGLQVQGVDKSEQEKRAKEALRMVGLKGWEDSLPGQLSGGMRQRVGLARALAAGTNIMLMDEAFSALDPLIKREMQDQLVELQRDLNKTILFITHDLNEAMRLGDRIAMMRDGRIVQNGTPAEILAAPANDFVAQFVQDVDRSRVLTVASVMEAGNRSGSSEHRGQVVSHRARLTDVLGLSASSAEPLAVVDDNDTVIGSLPQGALLKALAQNRGSDQPQAAGATPVSATKVVSA